MKPIYEYFTFFMKNINCLTKIVRVMWQCFVICIVIKISFIDQIKYVIDKYIKKKFSKY